MKTRAQKDLEWALKEVSKHKDKNERVRNAYGNLCHHFPLMVRTCGLCQAVTFCFAKTKGDDQILKEAHEMLLANVEDLINETDSISGSRSVVDAVRQADAVQYMLYTRRILSAWIYFKRFAESILEVGPGG